MKQNQITTVPVALDVVSSAISGATDHGTTIGLKHNTVPVLTTDKNALSAADAAVDVALAELKARRAVLANASDAAISFIYLTRDLMKPTLGKRYSTAWNPLGFSGSLNVPRSSAKVKFVLQKLIGFLTENADMQSAEKNVTPERAQSLLDSIVTNENSAKAQEVVLRDAVKARQAKLKLVADRISSLVRELTDRIDPMDSRWIAFGLNLPGAKAIPAIPANVIAVLVGPTAAAVTWDRAARAESYHLWKKVIGVDTEMVRVETREDLDFVFEGLPSGKTVQLAVSAVNNGGESQLSQPVSVVTP